MDTKKHKIPFTLKIKRIKNSKFISDFNNLFSYIKPKKRQKLNSGKLLFFRNDRIGDAMVTLPVLRDLKKNYPDIKIDILVSSRNKFVFNNFDYVDEIIEYDRRLDDLNKIYKIPVLGSVLQFMLLIAIPYLTNKNIRGKINKLRNKKYDAAIDLVGLKRNLLLGKILTGFTIGPKSLGTYIFYDYYMDDNWVTAKDNDFITKKIEFVLKDSLGLIFYTHIKDSHLTNYSIINENKEKYDLIYHRGAPELRRFSFEKEIEILKLLDRYKVLVTDSGSNEHFKKLKDIFNSIDFKIFHSLEELSLLCHNSKILLCYDGGQAHYLSQFIKTVTIFGPGSVSLWRPYEFEDYIPLTKDKNGCEVLKSKGKLGHVVINYPIWCRPCFDTGCKERVCLKKIEPGILVNIITNYCLNND